MRRNLLKYIKQTKRWGVGNLKMSLANQPISKVKAISPSPIEIKNGENYFT